MKKTMKKNASEGLRDLEKIERVDTGKTTDEALADLLADLKEEAAGTMADLYNAAGDLRDLMNALDSVNLEIAATEAMMEARKRDPEACFAKEYEYRPVA